MDQIINLRNYPAKGLDERLTLARREYPGMKIVYVGRPTVLGNPYELNGNDKFDKAAALSSVDQYRKYLWKRLEANDPRIIESLKAIDENTILACWCYPNPCHSTVIWNAWHWLKSKERVRCNSMV